jgi:small-conductance mechanosensitive channel
VSAAARAPADWRRLLLPALAAALAWGVGFVLVGTMDVAPAFGLGADGLRLVMAVAGCLSLAWFAARAFDLALTGAMARRGQRAPRLAPQLTAAALFLVALIAAPALAFDRPLVGALTTSGVAVAVLGFALRNIIADVFSGIALGFENAYRIGDWIEAEPGVSGRVVEINWRATRIETRDRVHLVLPNSRLAAGRVANYSAPRPWYRAQVQVTLDGSTPVARARRVLLAAASSAERIRREPAPDVRVTGFGDGSVDYVVRYWIPSFADAVDCRDAVLSSIDRHARRAGLALPRRPA